MDVSPDRKVVLEQYKELPNEVLFRTSEAECDQHVKNRYWFNFPENWANQRDKDPILGIRSLFCTPANRRIQLKLRFVSYALTTDKVNEVTDPTVATYEGVFDYAIDNQASFTEICRMFNSHYMDNGEITITDGWSVPDLESSRPKLFQSHAFAMSYSITDDGTILTIGLNSIKTYHRKTTVTETGQNVDLYTFPATKDGTTHDCYIAITVSALNDDTRLLGFDGQKENDPQYGTIYTKYWYNEISYNVWSRHNCYVRASFSNASNDNFLGFTHYNDYTPMKYFRINTKSKRFWIELYDNRNNKTPVELPSDNKDDVLMEAVYCFSSSGMLG